MTIFIWCVECQIQEDTSTVSLGSSWRRALDDIDSDDGRDAESDPQDVDMDDHNDDLEDAESDPEDDDMKDDS